MKWLRRLIGWPHDQEADALIINALISGERRSGLDIIRETGLSIGRFYARAEIMEEVGTIKSIYAMVAIPSAQQGLRPKLYWLASTTRPV